MKKENAGQVKRMGIGVRTQRKKGQKGTLTGAVAIRKDGVTGGERQPK